MCWAFPGAGSVTESVFSDEPAAQDGGSTGQFWGIFSGNDNNSLFGEVFGSPPSIDRAHSALSSGMNSLWNHVPTKLSSWIGSSPPPQRNSFEPPVGSPPATGALEKLFEPILSGMGSRYPSSATKSKAAAVAAAACVGGQHALEDGSHCGTQCNEEEGALGGYETTREDGMDDDDFHAKETGMYEGASADTIVGPSCQTGNPFALTLGSEVWSPRTSKLAGGKHRSKRSKRTHVRDRQHFMPPTLNTSPYGTSASYDGGTGRSNAESSSPSPSGMSSGPTVPSFADKALALSWKGRPGDCAATGNRYRTLVVELPEDLHREKTSSDGISLKLSMRAETSLGTSVILSVRDLRHDKFGSKLYYSTDPTELTEWYMGWRIGPLPKKDKGNCSTITVKILCRCVPTTLARTLDIPSISRRILTVSYRDANGIQYQSEIELFSKRSHYCT